MESDCIQGIDKLKIADELLETAIENYLDKKKYFSALHLSGAAQEIYGQWLRYNGSQDYSSFMLDQAGKIFASQGGVINKESVKKSDKYPKNTIKHLNNKNDRYTNLNPEFDSFMQITEAIMDYSFLKRIETNNIVRFKEYIIQTKKQNQLITD